MESKTDEMWWTSQDIIEEIVQRCGTVAAVCCSCWWCWCWWCCVLTQNVHSRHVWNWLSPAWKRWKRWHWLCSCRLPDNVRFQHHFLIKPAALWLSFIDDKSFTGCMLHGVSHLAARWAIRNDLNIYLVFCIALVATFILLLTIATAAAAAVNSKRSNIFRWLE